ncbi:MAG: hypothetical protein U0936_28245 [Planctomycetaceae bacterium]
MVHPSGVGFVSGLALATGDCREKLLENIGGQRYIAEGRILKSATLPPHPLEAKWCVGLSLNQ